MGGNGVLQQAQRDSPYAEWLNHFLKIALIKWDIVIKIHWNDL